MKKLNILESSIKIGLRKPIKLLHITDSHIFRGNDSGYNRKSEFDIEYDGCTEDYFFEALEYAKNNNLPIIHTGDLIDFFSAENFLFIDKHFDCVDYIYAAGNHDFVDWADVKRGQQENTDYKEKQIKLTAPHIKNNLYFSSRIIDGVNIVTMDDSYYRITSGQLDMLKAEVAKGYPIILCMHIPIYAPKLAKASIPEWSPNVSHILGAPEELLAKYPDDRRAQQEADTETNIAIEYIKSEPLIKALITGHTHINHEEPIAPGKMQYTTHGTFAGYVREITII